MSYSIKIHISISMHCCAGNLFHLQWPIHMIAWPIEIFLKGPWAHCEKTFKITVTFLSGLCIRSVILFGYSTPV